MQTVSKVEIKLFMLYFSQKEQFEGLTVLAKSTLKVYYRKYRILVL